MDLSGFSAPGFDTKGTSILAKEQLKTTGNNVCNQHCKMKIIELSELLVFLFQLHERSHLE